MNTIADLPAIVDETAELDFTQQLDAASVTVAPEQVQNIRVDKAQYSTFEFLRQVVRGTITIPEFQRHSVWTPQQQSEFIESVMLGIPLPLIYLFENEQGVRQVIDGRQRFETLKRFVGNGFKLTGLQVLCSYNKLSFEQLPPLMQHRIEDHQLTCHVLQPPTPEAIKFSVFDRVNRGGTQLNKQEMRHALYQGSATQLLLDIADTDGFKQAIAGAVNWRRMKDHYLILRFLGFYLYHQQQLIPFTYNGDVDGFLAMVMQTLNRLSAPELAHLKALTLQALTLAHDFLAGQAFRFTATGKSRRPVNAGLFEMQLFVCQSQNAQICDSQTGQAVLLRMLEKAQQANCCGQRLNESKAFIQRFELASAAIKELKNA